VGLGADIRRFRNAVQAPGESGWAWIRRLTKYARVCDEPTNSEAFRMQFLQGMRDKTLAARAVEEGMAISQLITILATREHTRVNAPQAPPAAPRPAAPALVAVVRRAKTTRPAARSLGNPILCGKCGGPHGSGGCKAEGRKCHACGMMGHYERCCKKSKRNPKQDQGGDNKEDKDPKVNDK
jgi:hypothetical protein